MKFTKTSDANRTLVFDITIPQEDITKRYAQALTTYAKKAKIEGFREGKAPVALVEKNTGKEVIYDQLIQTLLPDAYKALLEAEKFQPVISPKVDLKHAKEGEDWILTMTIALAPQVKIPDYKKIVKKVRGNAKKDEIWVPGKDDTADKGAVEKREKFLNDVLKELLEQTDIELSDLIIDEEINQRLARLIDDIRRIGLTIESYLESRKTTQDELREEFKKDIINTYKLEYALNGIGDDEKITIENAEIETMIESMPDEASKKEARQNAYVYGMMLRKQKILDFLGNL